jgi:molybdenum cofactor cytidylyltransferase
MTTIDLLLLSAGASSRMGSPKMLLPFRGQALLSHFQNEGLKCNRLRRMLILSGCHHEVLLTHIMDHPAIQLARNPHWEQGMGSSIAFGVRQIMQNHRDAPDALVIMTCDQPWVDASALNRLMECPFEAAELTQKTQLSATPYDPQGNHFGPPALFGSAYAAELMGLNSDQGAKSILLRHRHRLRLCPWNEKTPLDWDGPQDLNPRKSNHHP